MLNIFDNIKVEAARTETNAGQFRYEVRLLSNRGVLDLGEGKTSRLVLKKEFVIDTTDDLSECVAVAEAMVKEENKKRGS